MPPDSSESSFHGTHELEALSARGVIIPAPNQVAIGREVPLQAIAPGVQLLPFCRLTGAATRLDAGAVIAAAGPATLHDSWVGARAVVGNLGPVTLREVAVGPSAVLGSGEAEQAVFLGKEVGDPAFTTGYGFRARKGSLYEEDANSAQHTDTKMTVLFPWVTLGSNLNWCDVLVAGGTGPALGEFSEVGSGAVHFNFTPRGDKATGSLLGDVTEGVFLRAQRLFIGGNASLIGPLTAAFGAVTTAGGRFQRELRPGLNVSAPQPGKAAAAGFDPDIYGSVRHLYVSQLRLIGELAALDAWYAHIRRRVAGRDAARLELYARGRTMVQLNLRERIDQLGSLAARMERSCRLLEHRAPGDVRIVQQRALLDNWPRIETHLSGFAGSQPNPPPALLEALDSAVAKGGSYTGAIRALPEDAVRAGRDWLREITRSVATPEMLALVPPLRRSP